MSCGPQTIVVSFLRMQQEFLLNSRQSDGSTIRWFLSPWKSRRGGGAARIFKFKLQPGTTTSTSHLKSQWPSLDAYY